MDACHIQLGRPWLSDRKVKHDGCLNTYSFSKDGKRITLAPWALPRSRKTSPKRYPLKLAYSSLLENHYLRHLI